MRPVMKTLNIHETKTHISRHLKAVEAGESFVISNVGKPVAKLVPLIVEVRDGVKPKRELGWAKGKWNVPDDIKTPLKDDIDEMFGLKD